MKHESNAAKSNIITLNIRPKGKRISNETLLRMEDDFVANRFVENAMEIANKVDIKGFAMVAWDERGTPCIAWQTGHPQNLISNQMLPAFTQTCFSNITNERTSTPEDFEDDG